MSGRPLRPVNQRSADETHTGEPGVGGGVVEAQIGRPELGADLLGHGVSQSVEYVALSEAGRDGPCPRERGVGGLRAVGQETLDPFEYLSRYTSIHVSAGYQLSQQREKLRENRRRSDEFNFGRTGREKRRYRGGGLLLRDDCV